MFFLCDIYFNLLPDIILPCAGGSSPPPAPDHAPAAHAPADGACCHGDTAQPAPGPPPARAAGAAPDAARRHQHRLQAARRARWQGAH